MYTIGIVGYGVVGKAVHKLFPDALFYDPLLADSVTQNAINKCSVVFICVPTNQGVNGECDTSIVTEVVAWLTVPLIIIRSTVAPGTTDALQKTKSDQLIVFQPEYVGESVDHPLMHELERTFVILGGTRKACEAAINVYHTVYNAGVKLMIMSAIEAEITKYMENTAIGCMVILCNEFYNICRAFGVSYNVVREAFLLDPRMSRYFTFVYPENRGFGGKCLPKDLNAIVQASTKAGYVPKFISDVLTNNNRIKSEILIP